MKNAFKKVKLDTDKYVNIDTGETLESEHPNLTSANIKDTDNVVISSKEYFIIDSRANEYIKENFNHAERGRIYDMSDMVQGCYNILHKKDRKTPHTKDTLMSDLDYTRNMFAKFMEKLYKKSIIYYLKGYKDGKECVYIMLNPYMSRKSKVFSKDCTSVFKDISK